MISIGIKLLSAFTTRWTTYLAFQWNPRLYCQIMEEHVSFDHIAKAWWIGNDPDDPVGKNEKRISQFLEYLARRKFSEQHGSIEKATGTKSRRLAVPSRATDTFTA